MTHLKVAVRVRPLSSREIEAKSSPVLRIDADQNTISVTNTKVPEQNVGDSRERIRRFTFDFCFDQNSTQEDVFQAVESVVGRAMERRYHSCVLAYGQSSSGKTHTMMGFPHDPGLIPRLCQRIFGYIQETAVGNEMEAARTSVSFLEIYNEKVRDLLCDGDGNKVALKVRHHPKKGPYVQGLTEHLVEDPTNLLSLLKIGDGARQVSATLTNPQSSRSHAVFIINCAGVKLTLVDLAGSERACNKSYGTSTFREGANINKSLVALGNVISALAELATKNGFRRKFIPFRDSVLTWLLKDTLGGSSDTVMIATVSPSSACYSETVNTLRFGQRAKLIVTAPVVNEDPREKTIRELRTEIARLKELINKMPLTRPTTTLEEENVGSKSNEGQDGAPSTNEDKLISEVNKKQTLEKLLPVMSVTSSTVTTTSLQNKLKRTFSVEHGLAIKSKKFGSEEAITNKTRRPSLDKTSRKFEKATGTDNKPFLNVSPRVDSIRKIPIQSTKPRSHIVAAVTHRLYAKTRKKDTGTDTNDLSIENHHQPKELQICSNARSRLKELTRKALKAHKSRNEETQTDWFPVLRVKEMSTDMNDLKMDLNEVKNVETSTELIETRDKAIECTFLERFSDDRSEESKNKFLISTRSCGTQSSSCDTLSFTKYLTNQNKRPEIYTNTVNIDIGHNKSHNTNTIKGDHSDDSLDLNRDNLCFPTPDLISNHNSLEPSTHAIQLQHASPSSSELSEEVYEILCDFHCEKVQDFQAQSSTVPFCHQKIDSIDIPIVFASQLCLSNLNPELCQNFYPSSNRNHEVKAKIVETKTYVDDCVTLTEPLVLKSIMKHIINGNNNNQGQSHSESSEDDEGIPDSLEYHMANSNKKVRFISKNNEKLRNDKLFRVMSGFLEEATILMNNLSTTVTKIDSFRNLDDFDLQVTINEVSGLSNLNQEDHKRRKSAKSQTDSAQTRSEYAQTQDFQVPGNKYEMLLEDSCRRLEEKLNCTPCKHQDSPTRTGDYNNSGGFSYNPWDLSNNDNLLLENGSLESNAVTFSDYGSLPRRSKRNHNSPSAYLRQLTSMRRHVVESSREQLHDCHHHHHLQYNH